MTRTSGPRIPLKTQRSFCVATQPNNPSTNLAPSTCISNIENIPRKHVMKKATSTRDLGSRSAACQLRSSLNTRGHQDDEALNQYRDNNGTPKSSSKLGSLSALMNWLTNSKKSKNRIGKTSEVPSEFISESFYHTSPTSSTALLNRTRSRTAPSSERPLGTSNLSKEKFRATPLPLRLPKSSFSGRNPLISGFYTKQGEQSQDHNNNNKKDSLGKSSTKSSIREVSFEIPISIIEGNNEERNVEILANKVEENQSGPQRFLNTRDCCNHQELDEDDDRSSFNTLDGRESDFDDQEIPLPRWPGSPDS